MRAMTCEMCGSTELVKQNGMFVCQYCGTKYSVEEAKKLLGSVKIDKTDEKEKLLILARRARSENNSENAEKYYGMVLQDDPDNWEAAFFQVYYAAMQCKIMNISSAAYSVANCIDNTFRLVSNLESEAEQEKAVLTLLIYIPLIANAMSEGAKSHYEEFQTVDGAFSECTDRIVAAEKIFENTEKAIIRYYTLRDDYLLEIRKSYNSFVGKYGFFFNTTYRTNLMNRLTEQIKEEDESYVAPTVNTGGGCYVATAVYGSYDCPSVWTLRRFRDYTLAEARGGRAFIKCYYAISPTLVRWFGDTKLFTRMCKPCLDKLVNRLNANGVADTPYNDKIW